MDQTMQTKLIIALIAFFILFLYFNDKFSKNEFQEKSQNLIGRVFNNSTVHSFVDGMKYYTNLMAASVSSAIVAVIANLPVCYDYFSKLKLCFFLKENFQRTETCNCWISNSIYIKFIKI